MKHEDFISKSIFCGNDWKNSEESRQSAIGIAMMCGFLKGIKPSIDSMGKYLDMPRNEINKPFGRLLNSGVFSKKFNALKDKELTGLGLNDTNFAINSVPESVMMRNAWCHIGAIASGVISRNYNSTVASSRE